MQNDKRSKTECGGATSFAEHLDVVRRVLLLSLLLLTPLVVWQVTGLPKPPVKQALAELLTVFMVVLWVLRMNETRAWRVRVSRLTIAVALLVAVEALSVIVATNRGHALRTVRQIAFPFLFYLVIVNNVRGKREIRHCIIAVTVAAFLVSGYGLIQSTGADFAGWCEEQEARVLAPSSFQSPATAASFLVIAFPLAVALIFDSRSIAAKLGAGAVAAIILSHIRLTLSAESIVALELAMLAGSAVMLITSREQIKLPKSGLRQPNTVRIIASTLCVLVALGAAHAFTVLRTGSEALHAVTSRLQNEQFSRKAAWECASRMALAHPIIGTGIGSYQIDSPRFWSDFQKRWFARFPDAEDKVESEYLRLAAESGLVGLGTALLVITLSCTRLLAVCRRSIGPPYLTLGVGCSFVAIAVDAFSSSSFRHPTVLFYFFFLLAMIDVSGSAEQVQGQPGTHDDYRKRWPTYYLAWAASIVLAVLAPWIVVRPLAYYQHVESGKDYVQLEMFDAAKEEFVQASNLYPCDWVPYMLRASASAAQNKLSAVVWLYGVATSLHPNHLAGLVKYGEARAEWGSAEGAITTLEKAVRLNPYISAARYSLGEAYAAIGNWEAALDNFQAAERTGFAYRVSLHLSLARCLYHLGKYSQSDERLSAAVDMVGQDAQLWYDVATVELERDHKGAAFTALNRALSLSERYPLGPDKLLDIHRHLALLNLDERDNIVAASYHAARATEIDRGDARITEPVKRLLELAQSDRVKEKSPLIRARFFYNLAMAVSHSSVGNDPVPLFEQAISAAKGREPIVMRNAYVGLAESHVARGYYSAALAALGAAERLDPFDPNVFRVRGHIYEAAERDQEARAAYLHALRIQPSDTRSRTAFLRLEGLAKFAQ